MDENEGWSFVADMNYDGAVTISDVWLWFNWLYFYPGDWLISKWFLGNPVGQFLEFTINDLGGFFSGVISFIAWGIVLTMIVSIWEAMVGENNNPLIK